MFIVKALTANSLFDLEVSTIIFVQFKLCLKALKMCPGRLLSKPRKRMFANSTNKEIFWKFHFDKNEKESFLSLYRTKLVFV